MPASAALQRFVDDELMRATLLAEQIIEEAVGAMRRDAGSMTPRERTLAGDVQRALNQHRSVIVREFVRSLTDHVQRELDGSDSTRNALPSSLGGLALVDEGQVEVDVEISRVIEAIRSVAEHEARELMTYTSALVGDMDVARDYNPFRPEVIGRALWEAAQSLPLQRAYQLAFMRHACMPAAQLVRKSYAGACSRLEQQGVEPAVYRTIIVFGSRRTRGQEDSFFDPQANRTERSTPLPGPGGRPPQPPADVLPNAGPRPTIDQVLKRTEQLLRNLPEGSDRQQRERLRNLQRQQLAASADQAADRELIEVIDQLFDAVLGDRRLETDMQGLVSRLQAPALRLSLSDPATLDNHAHPIWLFMDRVALQGEVHPRPGDPERTRMLRFVHGLLDTLADEHNSDGDAFRWARERLIAFERARFEQRRGAAEAEIGSLQALEHQAMAGGPPTTVPAALDIGQLDTVPAELLDDLSATTPADEHPGDPTAWTQARRSGEWVHMFMQGAWFNAQLLWYGEHREYWLLADGASANTWAVRRRALERMLQQQLLSVLAPRSLIREAAARVLKGLK